MLYVVPSGPTTLRSRSQNSFASLTPAFSLFPVE
jgi:hypothetical protein